MVQALCRRNGTGPYSRSGSTKAELATPFILWGDFGGEGPPRPAKRYWRRFPESEHMRRHLGGRVQRGIRSRPKGSLKGVPAKGQPHRRNAPSWESRSEFTAS